jgi:hypothetical protein
MVLPILILQLCRVAPESKSSMILRDKFASRLSMFGVYFEIEIFHS